MPKSVNPGPDTPLTPQQGKLVAAILTHTSIVAAAESIKISRQTAYNYLELPQVQRALEQAQQKLLSEAQMMLQVHAVQSIDVIVAIRDNEIAPFQVRLKAAEDLKAHIPLPTESQETASGLPAELLPWATLEELSAIEAIMKTIEARKLEQEARQAQKGPRP